GGDTRRHVDGEHDGECGAFCQRGLDHQDNQHGNRGQGHSLTLLSSAFRDYKRIMRADEDAAMKSVLVVGIGLALGFDGLSAIAATKPPAGKAPPACAAITFRAVPSGMTDGEQQAGMYKSRHARTPF